MKKTTITSSLTSASLLFSLIVASSFNALAKVEPPPKLEKLEEITEADIKSVKPKEEKIKMKERRQHDVTTEVEVTSGNSTYVVKPNQAPKGTREGDANKAVMWKVKEFGGKPESKTSAAESNSEKALPVLPPGQYSTSKTGVTKPAVEGKKSKESAASAASASASQEKK